MRLDARSPGFRGVWWVYDVPACKIVKNVVWIDTDLAQLGFYPEPFRILRGEIAMQVEQRKKIELAGRTFLLDPIEDGIGSHEETTLDLKTPSNEGAIA